jgi:nitrate reductase gamma subunit
VSALLWIVVPYLCLAVFVVGHGWRWRHDQFGWTSHTSQLLESRILRLGSPLFHLGVLGVIAGHAMGLLIPEWLTEDLHIPEGLYHGVAVWGGALTGTMVVVGLGLLIARRFAGPSRVRRTTTPMDRVLYIAMAGMVVLGMWETVGVWFRSIFWFSPDTALMSGAPLVYQLHAVGGFLFLALWPFTRLVHVWSAPLAYLWRPYVVYRSRRAVVPPQASPAQVRDQALAAADTLR